MAPSDHKIFAHCIRAKTQCERSVESTFQEPPSQGVLRHGASCRRECFHARTLCVAQGLREGAVHMQLWGFSVSGDLTVTVQDGPCFLQ
jgi:hypothetical protein